MSYRVRKHCLKGGLPWVQDLSSGVGTVVVTNLVPEPDSKGCVTVIEADGGTLNRREIQLGHTDDIIFCTRV